METQTSLKAEKKTLDKITIFDIFVYIIKYKLLILFCVLLGLALGMVLQVFSSQKDIKPNYLAMSSMLVTPKPTYAIENGEPIYNNSSDLSLAKSILPTVTYLIKTDRVIEMLTDQLDETGLNADLEDVKKSITLNNAENTPIIEVTLIWPDKLECLTIINALMEILPQAMLETINVGSVTVIDNATEAKAVYSVPTMYVIIGALAGLAFGIIISVTIGILSPKVRNQKDIKNLLKLETIAELPLSRKKSNMLLNGGDIPIDYREACAIMGSIFKHTTEKHNIKTVYITSSISGEGKTTVSVNLALSLSQKKKRVVLIDTDIHRPMISVLLGISDETPTLQDVLDDFSLMRKAQVQVNEYMLVLRTRSDELTINADDFKSFITAIEPYADYIIIDTPPVGLVSDALSFNSCVDGVMFVIKQDFANMGLVADSINMIKDSGANVFGCILNGKRQAVTGKYYTKGRYYNDYTKKNTLYAKNHGSRGNRSRYYNSNNYNRNKKENPQIKTNSEKVEINTDLQQINPKLIADAVSSFRQNKSGAAE